MEVVFAKENAFVKHPETSKVIMVAKRINNLYCFQENEACRVAQLTHSTLQEWHERFGHLNENDLKDVIRQRKVSGIKAKPDGKLPICETCIKGKQAEKCIN